MRDRNDAAFREVDNEILSIIESHMAVILIVF